ncbi:BrnT family toxin [Jiella avicenniae]|uniref:BrnT family toxin n=1 Tax=Jiella avicenniae TaxID=2907202 RepID=A0A9X1P147_9HYPH|nr:BrnT family toxin [Jiella avicenniae]MCE7027423.1 BrnT family toxin [Jiella avicenniae]
MRIVWDEPKRYANIAKHGLDFRSLTTEFFEAAVTAASRDGRFLAIGPLEPSSTVSVVFKPLGSEAVSVISMRPASPGERRFHDEFQR